jgi:hypothetical protein
MSDSYAAPPVSPSEGTPTQPSVQVTNDYFEKLEVDAEEEKYRYMAAQVPPIMQDEFLAMYPPIVAKTPAPKDMEDIRQSRPKRGDPAPNEPKEYLEIGNDVENLPEHSDNLPPQGGPAGQGEGSEAPSTSRRLTVEAIKAREEKLVKEPPKRRGVGERQQAAQPAAQPEQAAQPYDPNYPPAYPQR